MNQFASPLMQLDLGQPVPSSSDVFEALRGAVQKEIQRQLSPEEQIAVRAGGIASGKARQVILEKVAALHLAQLANPSLGRWPGGSDATLAERLYRLLYGLGPIEVLLEQPGVEDIAVNGPKEISIRTTSGWSQVPTDSVSDLASDSEGLLFMFNQAISPSGQQAGPLKPVIDERLPGGHRIAIITEPVASDGVWPLVVIRRHQEVAFQPLDFIRAPVEAHKHARYELLDTSSEWNPGSLLTPASLLFLQMAVLSGMNILILGRTGVGKTAFLSMLGQMIPEDRRIVVLEDTRELKLRKGKRPANCVYLTTVPERLEGGIQVPMSQLVIAALRQRPDHLVLGEARGPEMWDLLNAMQTGHGGNLTSIHAVSARQLIERIQFMISLPPVGIKLTRAEAGKLASTSFQVVITYQMDWNGRRYLADISAYTGQMMGDEPELETLFTGGPAESYILRLVAPQTHLEEHLNLSGLSFEEVVRMAEKEAGILAGAEPPSLPKKEPK
jgi:pilus assembly protein CpaF